MKPGDELEHPTCCPANEYYLEDLDSGLLIYVGPSADIDAIKEAAYAAYERPERGPEVVHFAIWRYRFDFDCDAPEKCGEVEITLKPAEPDCFGSEHSWTPMGETSVCMDCGLVKTEVEDRVYYWPHDPEY